MATALEIAGPVRDEIALTAAEYDRTAAFPFRNFEILRDAGTLTRSLDAKPGDHGMRLEAACRRAQALEAFTYKSVQSILKTGLDQQPLPEPVPRVPLPIEHAHLRGTTYYQQEGDC